MSQRKRCRRIPALFLLVAGLLVPVIHAQVPPGYYGSANGKTGSSLRQALHDIIDDHNAIPFSSSSSYDTHDALEDLDEDPNNPLNVILVYSGYSVPKSTWPDWNREHLWPKSYGTGTEPAEADLFNMTACDMNVNSSRGNKYFDDGGTSFHPEAPECFYDHDSWEPRDVEKGDIARAMFYMDIRYSGDDPNELDLELTDDTGLIVSGSRYMGKLSTLLQWHELDPVDDKERIRNDFIYYSIQANRNPFVDNPSWVYSIWGGDLSVDRYSISESSGGTANFELDASTKHAYRSYIVFGGITGTSPGLPLPGGHAVLPINWDVFTTTVINLANSPIFANFMGNLSGTGTGSSQMHLPPVPGGAGLTLYFAYALNSPWDFASNPVQIVIEP